MGIIERMAIYFMLTTPKSLSSNHNRWLHLIPGETYTITVVTDYYKHNVRGWIDFNNDGIFQSAELVISSNGTTNFQTHTASFTVPASGVPTCTSLRMRIGQVRLAAPSGALR